MTEGATTLPVPKVDFLLPGRWWQVPLDSPERIKASAKGMAQETFGRRDDRAQLRAELIAEVVRAGETARAADCQDFWFAQELGPGERVPLSLTSAFPELADVPSRAATGQVAAAVLAAKLVATVEADTVEPIDVDDELGVVRVTQAKPHVEVDGEITELGRLTLTYWVLKQHSRRALVLSFTTPLVEAREELTFLADAIVASVRWPDDDASPMEVAPGDR